jgi:hypothetical protein
LRPLWQPWLGAVILAAAASDAITFLAFRAVPIEFFVLSSALGALAGVWVARRIGLRTAWIMGVVVGLGIDTLAFVAASLWVSWAVVHVNKVG